MKNALIILVIAMLTATLNSFSLAADTRAVKVNEGTIGLVVSRPESLIQAVQISNAVDHTDGLRILPILGRGGLQSINDLLFIRGVDVAMVPSDCLAFARKNNLYTDETGKISYLAKIGDKNVVIVANAKFTTLQSLSGKRVAVGPTESDEFVIADLVLGGMELNFERVPLLGKSAVEALNEGRVDAAIFSGSNTSQELSALKTDSQTHVLPISLNESLSTIYSPAILSNNDLPSLIPAGTTVDTIASSEVLAVFDWPKRSQRGNKIEKFNRALFANYFASISKDGSINFLATVPGWKPYVKDKQTSGAKAIQPRTTTALQ